MNRTALIILLIVLAGVIVWYFVSARDHVTVTPPPPTGNGGSTTTPITQPEAENRTTAFFENNTSVTDYISGLVYVSAVDWPPAIQVLTGEKYSCEPAGNEIDRGGATTAETINGNSYCVTKSSEGAAGSVYTQYAYARDVNGTPVIATFSFRFPQCMNYDEPEQGECMTEEESFSVNEIIDSLFGRLAQR